MCIKNLSSFFDLINIISFCFIFMASEKIKKRKKIKDASKESVKEFSQAFKRPIFILGIVFWIGLLLFFTLSSVVSFRTGNVVNTQEVFGVSGVYLYLILFVVLGVLLFFVWKYMIKKKRNN